MYSLNVIVPPHLVLAHPVNILHGHLLQPCLIDARSCVQDGLLLIFFSVEAHAVACLEIFLRLPTLSRQVQCL